MKPPSRRTCFPYWIVTTCPLNTTLILSNCSVVLKRGKISELWYLALHSQKTCHWLVILFINRISQVLRFHKMALPGRPFLEERLLELVMWLFGCSCIHHSRQYVRFHVNPFQGGTWFKNYSKRVQVSNTRIFHSLTTFIFDGCQTYRTLISDECLQWSPFQLRKTF